jgi:hypothetical protein
MQGRSWMAASTISAGMLAILGLVAQVAPVQAQTQASDPKPRPKAEAKPVVPETTTPTYVVKMDLKIAGLGKKGCDVEIRPGNGGCKFKDIETQSADRDCTFAITVHEPGQAEKTVKRGLRLKSPGDPGQSLDCFLSSPSKIAKAAQESATKR